MRPRPLLAVLTAGHPLVRRAGARTTLPASAARTGIPGPIPEP
jgi:hypothetical protein